MSTQTAGGTSYDRINDYGEVRISLASPHDIRSWSFGEVKKPETINYRTYRPEKDGLFCERIFGPEKDWECACGKYRGEKYRGMICDRCGVKITHSRVRRKRMGHIELAAPVVHIWFFKANRCYLGWLLEMKRKSLEKVIYFQDYVITEPDGNAEIQQLYDKKQTISEEQYRALREKYGDGFKAEMGAEAIKKLLEKLNLVELSVELRDKLRFENEKDKPSKQKQRDLVKRLKVVESLRDSGLGGPQNKPEWMVLECIPVIPPDLRPLVLLDSGNFATSDLNDLYRRIINRNNRLKKLVDLNAPEVIIRNEKRELQQSVDALFDNNRCKRPVRGSSWRLLKSLTDMIKGKQGRFRENLLGKRVDYSARSVIVVGPELRLHQCGLPKKIALELFQPFIIRQLKELGHADTIKSAKKMLERIRPSLEYYQTVSYGPGLWRLPAAQAALDRFWMTCPLDRQAAKMVLESDWQLLWELLREIEGATESFIHSLNSLWLVRNRPASALDSHLRILSMAADDGSRQAGDPEREFRVRVAWDAIKGVFDHSAGRIETASPRTSAEAESVWDVLSEVARSYPVLLNRNPTLHRMGIQAFEPVLIEGNAIRIHPLVCKGFNADFDGDQMAVHLPLSIEAQVEATVLMMSTNNIFSPANGQPIISPSQDIVMGCYYLTASRGEPGDKVEAGDGMIFANPQEVFFAFAQKKLGVHARIQVRLPIERRVISEVKTDKDKTRVEEIQRNPNGLVSTTVGRVIFNDILNPKMAFYDLALSSKHLARIIADCYQLLGRRETIDLLDRMKDTGFRESTRSGLSFATDDLRTPTNKETLLKETEKEVDKVMRQYQKGIITDVERYNKVIDLWTHARDEITKTMMHDLAHDRRPDEKGKVQPHLNPIYLMAISGARGGVEQIRQLAGMPALVTKGDGSICETPIESNLHQGLDMFEYFILAMGSRKALINRAVKTRDAGYLTRKLADAAQNVVVTMHDCGTTQGIPKGAVYKGEEIERSLSESIRGRVSRNTITTITGEEIVKENEMITFEQARKIEQMGLDKILVRSPMTCQAALGVCRLCYGMDLATGTLVEEGMAVGIIAAQSIGEPGTQLTMRTFHIGGVAMKSVEESKVKAKKAGTIKFERLNAVVNEKGERVALARNGLVSILGPRGVAIEKYAVPNGAVLKVEKGQQVQPGHELCEWDPHMTPILSDVRGWVIFKDIVEGETFRREHDVPGAERWVIMEHKGDLHPQIIIEDEERLLASYCMPTGAYLEVRLGQQVRAGTLLAKSLRKIQGVQDITRELRRITEIFEARTPPGPAVLAEVAGIVRLGKKKRGKRIIYVEPVDDDGKPVGDRQVEHQVPHGKHLRVHTGDYVKEGEPLVVGPLVPHDILRISGIEAVQQYLTREVQSVYRSQRVDIDDKHIEIIVSQMLRKVKVETTGDTGLLPGIVIDKFAFRAVNDRLKECVKIKDPGDSKFEADRIVSKEAFEEEKDRLEADGRRVPTWVPPTPATCSTQLLGITKAAVQSDSFISAASFQETTKVLTEAALAGKVDYLVGLKENVILGRLVPAGTGFPTHQESEVRLNAPEPAPLHGDGEPEGEAPCPTLQIAGTGEEYDEVSDPPVGGRAPKPPTTRLGIPKVPGAHALVKALDENRSSSASAETSISVPRPPAQTMAPEPVSPQSHVELQGPEQHALKRQLEEQQIALKNWAQSLELREQALQERAEVIDKAEAAQSDRMREFGRREASLKEQEQSLRDQAAAWEQKWAQVSVEESQFRFDRDCQRAQLGLREKQLDQKTRDLAEWEKLLHRRTVELEDSEKAGKERELRLNQWEQDLHQRTVTLEGREKHLEETCCSPSGVNLAEPLPTRSSQALKYPKRCVNVPGDWYARTKIEPGSQWKYVGRTPGNLTFEPHLYYCLSVSCVATDSNLDGLSELRNVAQIDTVQFSRCVNISDRSLLVLLEALEQLRALDLQACDNITDVGLVHLTRLQSLAWLRLENCRRITDGGLRQIGELRGLRHLSLKGCRQITDTGLLHLRTLTSLRQLDLADVPVRGFIARILGRKGITSRGIKSLRAALPNCSIRSNRE